MRRILDFVLVFLVCGVFVDGVGAKPVNDNFNDDNFYRCVIDSYNKEKGTNYDESYNLSDDELKVIGNLECVDSKIDDFSGIEKLWYLQNITLKNAMGMVDVLDFSHNVFLINLFYIDDRDTELTLNIRNNINLKNIQIYSDSIKNIDVSKNTKLEWLFISSENLSSLDLSKNESLYVLGINGGQFNNLDLSKNSLSSLSIEGGKLNNIDLSNVNLSSLSVDGKNFSNIDLSQHTNLKSLGIFGGQLGNIDLSKNTSLWDLFIEDAQFDNIDLSNNIELESLFIRNSNLDSLDLSKNINLKYLDLSNNNLETINLKNNVKLENLSLYGNNFMKNITVDYGKEVIIDNYISLPSRFNVSFELSDDTVATVVDNKIRGLKVGNTSGVLKITNTFNLVRVDDSASDYDAEINRRKYKYVLDDNTFNSNVKVVDKENQFDDYVSDGQNNADNNDKGNVNIKDIVNNPNTGVYTGSIVILLVSVIGYVLIKKYSILKRL